MRYLFCLVLAVLTALLYRPGEPRVKNQLAYLGCLLGAFHLVMRVYSTRKSATHTGSWVDTAEKAAGVAVRTRQGEVGSLGQCVVGYVVTFLLIRSLLA